MKPSSSESGRSVAFKISRSFAAESRIKRHASHALALLAPERTRSGEPPRAQKQYSPKLFFRAIEGAASRQQRAFEICTATLEQEQALIWR
jgi:hypothetical protein